MMGNRLSTEELRDLKKAGKTAAKALALMGKFIRPGISTRDIESFFDTFLEKHPGMEPAFKGYGGYPSSLCVSVNEEIIHGIPSAKKIVARGDLVSVDLGVRYKGLYVDTAFTYTVGRVSKEARLLWKTGWESLQRAIKKVRVGGYIGDIGETVQSFVESRGFSVVRDFVGHGVGYALHCPPEVPNFGTSGTGERLEEGMVIAIEPMICAGGFEVKLLEDGWTARTADSRLSCHFEHTVAVTGKGPLVITG